MAEISGNEILARCLKAQGVKDLFFIMGGPMLDAESCCIKEGIRLIDTRHEQGASYMAQACSRVTQGPGVCMAASGPATLNFGTGLANSLIDCCPVVAIGGSSPISQFGRQVFQKRMVCIHRRRDFVVFQIKLTEEVLTRNIPGGGKPVHAAFFAIAVDLRILFQPKLQRLFLLASRRAPGTLARAVEHGWRVNDLNGSFLELNCITFTFGCEIN